MVAEKRVFDRLHFRFYPRLPIYHQTESSECGITCLAMVASYHGYETTVETLRQKFPASLRGTNLKSLLAIGQRLKMSGRPMKVGLHALPRIQLPAILHWGFDHFVVLRKITRNKAIIHDPAQGERHLTLDELSDGYTGVAVEFSPNADFEQVKASNDVTIRSLWQHSQGLIATLGKVLLLSLFIQAFALVIPYFVQLAIDEVALSQDRDLLLVLGLGFLAIHFFRALTFALRGWVVAFVGAQLNFQLANNLFNHLMRLPLTFFAKRHVGDIVSRFGSLREINRVLTNGFVEAVVDGIVVLTVVVVMAYYSWTLTAVAVGVVMFYGTVRAVLIRPLRRLMEEEIINGAKEDSHFLESARAMETIRSFNHEPIRTSGWKNKFADEISSGVKVERIRIFYRSLSMFVTGAEHVTLVWIGVLLVIENDLTVGMLYAFLSYRQQFSDAALAFIDKAIEFRMLKLHLHRVSDIVIEPPERSNDEERGKMSRIEGNISVNNLTFRYHEEEAPVIKELSFEIEKGEYVAVTGPSGCGKTTLMKIMTGLMRPTSGLVLVDGVNIYDYGVRNFRDDIAIVSQGDQLFAGSILDNVTMFDDTPDMELAVQCAAAASIAEEVMKMPMGFQTLVGDLGSSLSGGQKQRILIARALYHKPKILFMDEATSHLDVDNEHRISEVIKSMGITRVAIAHRKETIDTADRVIRMTAVEEGQAAAAE
ncbi:peptidase domain-containing ABC transporter [Fodinicurvata sp. EGI_FJ10296]|uniref:peptidase domain-containing ABC transporter n=1 Tax=Fodinicurvata sp. EGI_FJ10296 TaxID=3231908 RepID=UPI003456A822